MCPLICLLVFGSEDMYVAATNKCMFSCLVSRSRKVRWIDSLDNKERHLFFFVTLSSSVSINVCEHMYIHAVDQVIEGLG